MIKKIIKTTKGIMYVIEVFLNARKIAHRIRHASLKFVSCEAMLHDQAVVTGTVASSHFNLPIH